ncbi:MAG TPA: hypothetical protein VD948_10760 [Rhodothermales bacterium]|nr:hypothetical protein [Rhodothermales bacterium]
MRISRGLCCVALAVLPGLTAGVTEGRGQPTMSELQALFQNATTVANRIQADSLRLEGVRQRSRVLLTEFATHNTRVLAHNNAGCRGQCDAYNQEADALDARTAELQRTAAGLIREATGYENSIVENTRRFQMLLMQIRTASLLGGLRRWYDKDVFPCTRMGPMAARGCLIHAWERHP